MRLHHLQITCTCTVKSSWFAVCFYENLAKFTAEVLLSLDTQLSSPSHN